MVFHLLLQQHFLNALDRLKIPVVCRMHASKFKTRVVENPTANRSLSVFKTLDQN